MASERFKLDSAISARLFLTQSFMASARRYGRSAIRMLFCKISEHILDEILMSGKVQIIVSAYYFTFGRNRSSKYIHTTLILDLSRSDVWLQLEHFSARNQAM